MVGLGELNPPGLERAANGRDRCKGRRWRGWFSHLFDGSFSLCFTCLHPTWTRPSSLQSWPSSAPAKHRL